jgi:hypothetical protein
MRKVARCVTIPVEWQLMGHCFCHTSRCLYAMKSTTQGPEQLAQCPLLFETSFVVRLWVIYIFARFRKAYMLRNGGLPRDGQQSPSLRLLFYRSRSLWIEAVWQNKESFTKTRGKAFVASLDKGRFGGG